jgi:thymidylate synthase
MNKLDKQYQQLLQDIIDYGVEKKDRTGTGTKSIFGYTIRHNMKDGFPLLTTKKMPWKTMVTELLWFLRGDTNIKYLVDNNCHIWDGDAYKNYCKSHTSPPSNPGGPLLSDNLISVRPIQYTQEEFINKIKTDDEFAKKWGKLGPIYGKQWRDWKFIDKFTNGQQIAYVNGKVDQIQRLINELKTNPDSRRLMVSAWNVGELDQMVLPPCHYGFQVYTRELSLNERRVLVSQEMFNQIYNGGGPETLSHSEINQWNIPTRAISLMWNQRSVDTFLGLPFNIASYGLLLEIIAKAVNMVPDELIGNLGDTHLYSNHIEQAKEQIGRKYTPEERSELLKTVMGEESYKEALNELQPFGGGLSIFYEMHKIPKYTREPYPLPRLILNPIFLANLEHNGFDEAINGQINFQLKNYQSHPTIKAPLSN